MTHVLWLLALQGLLGAIDTVWFHEWRGRLPIRPEMRPELKLHAVRSGVYGLLFATLPWFAWRGPWAVVLIALLVLEAVVTFADFVVEDRVRTSLGGLFPGERVMHGVMAVVYGAFLAGFVPELVRWIGGHGPSLGVDQPRALLLGLTALGVGSGLASLRLVLNLTGHRWAAFPWRHPAPTPVAPTVAGRRHPSPWLPVAGVAAIVTVLVLRRTRP